MTRVGDSPRLHNMEKGKAAVVVDAVLDLLLTEGEVRGETRLGAHRRYYYASALLVLTERLDGVARGTYETTTVGSGAHTTYTYVSAAVLYLEALGLVSVFRARGRKHEQSNVVERVQLLP